VVHVGCPVAPVRIEVGPGGGLNCDGVGHCALLCSLNYKGRGWRFWGASGQCPDWFTS
jgi:hypothetical protein